MNLSGKEVACCKLQKPFRLLISGGSGTGKSTILKAASYKLSVEDRDSFRDEMIQIVGERFRQITRYEWITMPLIMDDSPEIPTVTWGDVVVGAFIAFLIGRYIA